MYNMVSLQQFGAPRLITHEEISHSPKVVKFKHRFSSFQVYFLHPFEIAHSFIVWDCLLIENGKNVTDHHNFPDKLGLKYPHFFHPWKNYCPWSFDGKKFAFSVYHFGSFIYTLSTKELSKIEHFSVEGIIFSPTEPFILLQGHLLSTETQTVLITDLDGNKIRQLSALDGIDCKGLG